MRKPLIAALATLAGTVLLAGSASAQYYDPYSPYYRPPPPAYRPPPPYYGGGYYRPGRVGQTCVTSRGSCYSYPAPISSPCKCFIPGFGKKRGNIY
jgi:hypothetical protein